MSRNAGFHYYKEYFNDLKFDLNAGKVSKDSFSNNSLFNLNLSEVLIDYHPVLPASHFITDLTTSYPGLLIGSGYAHEIGGKEIEDELKLGFFFDHTSGLPCIPGSSLKGVLRSACEMDKGNYMKYILEELAIGKRESKVKNLASEFLKDNNSIIIVQHGKKVSVFVDKVFEGEGISCYKRDIFFDAFPVESRNINGKFLANDYITHHESPIKNPNPVQFMKVLPKVKFQFNFRLTDSIMSADLKLELFRQILLDLGIGAKTNVGYGQFEVRFGHVSDSALKTITDTIINSSPINFKQVSDSQPIPVVRTNKTEPAPYKSKIRQGEKLEAIVIDSTKKIVKAVIGGNEMMIPMSGICPENESVVLVTINVVNKKQEILQVGFLKKL